MLTKEFHTVKLPIVVSLSGGLDSSILLHDCVHEFGNRDVSAISFDYQQRHRRELTSAVAVASHLRVRHKIVEIHGLKDVALHSSQTDFSVPVPHGHYAAESMKTTVVPNRNAILLNYAAAWAISIGARTVAYAAHAGDHAIYPDCRPDFVRALSILLEEVHFEPIHLFTPFIDRTKREIVTDGFNYVNEMLIRLTYSCYEGQELHCGKCGTCVERKEALEGFDPTEYQA